MLGNLEILDIGNFQNDGKGGHQQILKIRLTYFENHGYDINIYQKYEMAIW